MILLFVLDASTAAAGSIEETQVACAESVTANDVELEAEDSAIDSDNLEEQDESAPCLSEIMNPDRDVTLDLTESEAEGTTDSVCQERDTAVVCGDNGSCRVVICGSSDV